MKTTLNLERIRKLNKLNYKNGPIVYWMSRDQRVQDNWALLYARELAERHHTDLHVVFCLSPVFLGAAYRQYDFIIKGLIEVEKELFKYNIPFHLLLGDPTIEIARYLKREKIGTLVTDFSPLRIKRDWNRALVDGLDIPIHEVDAHNIVPCWIASDKQEYAAYTFRPKINALLGEYQCEFPPLKKQKSNGESKTVSNNWAKAAKSLKVNKSVPPVDWISPGYKSGMKRLNEFLKKRLQYYADHRNDPNKNAQSDLSPYLHFGQISAQRIALEAAKLGSNKESVDSFLEELIVRRELADNFCYYNDKYDSFESFTDWARKTLNIHRKDKREFVYTLSQFENANTHDDLWNAAQIETVYSGKMHGYMRMYWAKKILEWSKTPEEALETAVYLNDKYELDGRDPNGYAGIAWSIGGVHDRAWPERKIFGKIRYMSYDGCRRKFDVDKYITKIANLKKSGK
ncbi:MAG: deoxyribodipyrimidine photo-lyase [Candidatus Zixiibacteriota bacterium]|nr:MAG: deoxyribodipyrimidine photo-lyase [candidate division Zixibacteria bacterium]